MNATHTQNRQEKPMVRKFGLRYVRSRLSCMGWQVLPLSNAQNPDISIVGQDAEKKFSIKVRNLSKRKAAGFGKNPKEKLVEDFVVVCQGVGKSDANPDCFILKREEVVEALKKPCKPNGDGQYWLEPKEYEPDDFREQWDKIGRGD